MRKFRRLIGVLLALCMVVAILPSINVQAKTKYKLNYTSKVVYEKDTFNLYPKYCYEKIKYKSSNTKVVAVNKDGLVKAKKAGKATITVTVGKQKMKCKVTVKAVPSKKDLSITQYTREVYGDTIRYLIITNNSKETINVYTNTKVYDGNNSLIGAATGDCYAIGSKQTSVLVEYFDSTTGIESYDTSYTVKISSYKDVLANLQVEEITMPDKVIFTAENKNDYDAYFVQVYAFLFKDGRLVRCESTYLVDDACRIKPNESYTEQMELYDEYDYIEFYYTGRGM